MKILAVSDQVIDRLYSTSVRTTYPDLRMIIGCGDLPYNYLEFLVSIFNIPMFYVPGNHDPAYDHHSINRAEGGINLDLDVAYSNGLLLAGLGGSIMYHPGSPNQYTQSEMYRRVLGFIPRVLWAQRRYGRRLDILVTHSPPLGIHDDDDPSHHGLAAINLFIKIIRPRYMLHGHTIFYRQNLHNHIDNVEGTQVVNVYPFRVMDVD